MIFLLKIVVQMFVNILDHFNIFGHLIPTLMYILRQGGITFAAQISPPGHSKILIIYQQNTKHESTLLG